MDKGRELYDLDLERDPVYRATGMARPRWTELSETAKNAWRKKAEEQTDA